MCVHCPRYGLRGPRPCTRHFSSHRGTEECRGEVRPTKLSPAHPRKRMTNFDPSWIPAKIACGASYHFHPDLILCYVIPLCLAQRGAETIQLTDLVLVLYAIPPVWHAWYQHIVSLSFSSSSSSSPTSSYFVADHECDHPLRKCVCMCQSLAQLGATHHRQLQQEDPKHRKKRHL